MSLAVSARALRAPMGVVAKAVAARSFATEAEMRQKIKTTTDIEKITSSMKLVAASKMKGDTARWTAALPFGNIFERLETIVASAEEQTKHDSTMVVVNASDRGLCGGINSQVGKEAKLTVETLEKDQKVQIAIVGEKGRSGVLKKAAGHLFKKSFAELSKNPQFAAYCSVAENIIDSDVDQFDIVYNHFLTQIAYEQKHRILPNLNPARKAEGGVIPDLVPAGFSGYEFEPECKAEALANFSEMWLASNLWYCGVDGLATEQTARRAAMDNASTNAADMVEKFTMQYNRLRQAKITTELCEIVAGAEALNDEH